MAKNDDEINRILASIIGRGNPNACPIKLALDKLDKPAYDAFNIAMESSKYQYPHVSIKKKLEEMSGQKIGRDAVMKHRRFLNGETGGCSCAGN